MWVVSCSLDGCPRVGLLGHILLHIFFFLRMNKISFHNGCTSLHFYQQCNKVLFTSSSALVRVVLICAILMDVKWYLLVLNSYFCFLVTKKSKNKKINLLPLPRHRDESRIVPYSLTFFLTSESLLCLLNVKFILF